MLRVVMPQVAGVRRAGSAALDLAYVAAGRVDGFWELGLKPWDTAAGVLHGIRASCRFAFGSGDLAGRSILVQGAGGVGGRLIEMLREAGADVIATDIDPQRLAALRSHGIKVVLPQDALATDCVVRAPCASGGILIARSIAGLRCRVIAGGANNQLEKTSDADLLTQRGIVYAPDFVINAGGVLHGHGLEVQRWSRETLDRHLAGIGDAVYAILERAQLEGISTDTAARRHAKSRLSTV
ncbi:MAG: hypothetical protein NVS1B3_07490 [Candidatus Dormibacteraceae bacterium]